MNHTELQSFPIENLEGLVRIAADRRANGMTWEEIATEINRSARTCRRWPNLYPELWMKYFRKGQVRALSDSTTEALATMKLLLHSEDETLRLKAASFIYATDLKTRQLESSTPSDETKPEHHFLDRFANYLKGLSHDQVQQLLRRFLQKESPLPSLGDGSNGISTSIDGSQ